MELEAKPLKAFAQPRHHPPCIFFVLESDRAILSHPVANKVLFAGEATVDFGFSQVPGAYTSGLREAERII